jgi:hypothetical protein
MNKRTDDYQFVVVESFIGPDSQGRNRPQIRPLKGQVFDANLKVECSLDLLNKHPLGTKFRIRAKLTDMQGAPFVYSYFGWPYEVVS